MAASDLATLADVKTWLAGSSGIGTSDDALISRLITDVSGAITAYLGRPSLTPRLFMERLDGNDKTRLFLRHYPVLQVITLLIDTAIVPAAAPVGMPSAKGYLLEAWDGLPPGRPQALDVFRTFFRKGRQNIVVDYSAGYAVQSEAASVPVSPGPYSVTAAAPLGPWASDAGVTYANGAPLVAVASNPAAGEYAVANGVYTNYEAGFQKIYWDEIADFRNGILYEVRQGDAWDKAQFIRSQAHPPFIAQGNGTFLIKARCQPVAGLIVYSENAAAIEISGNQLALNLLAGFDEKATGWAGTFQNGIGIDAGNLRLGGAGNILGANPLLQSVVTDAATSSGNVLSFGYLPPDVAVGMAVADTSTTGVIAALATVTAIDINAIDYGSVVGTVVADVDYGSVTISATTDIDYGSVTGVAATVTISAPVTGGGVLSGDTIVFSIPDVLDFGGVITDTPVYYTIPAAHIVNAGSVVQASVNASTQIVGVPVGQNVLADADVLTDPDILGSASTQYVDGWIEIALSQDGSSFGPWQKFVPGVYPALAWNFRLALQSSDPNTIAEALAFNYTVQLPSRIDHYQQQTVPSGSGLIIAFQRDGTMTPAAFNGGPGTADLPYVSVSWPPQAGDSYVISALSLNSLTIQFANGGVPVSRSNVNITVEGY